MDWIKPSLLVSLLVDTISGVRLSLGEFLFEPGILHYWLALQAFGVIRNDMPES